MNRWLQARERGRAARIRHTLPPGYTQRLAPKLAFCYTQMVLLSAAPSHEKSSAD